MDAPTLVLKPDMIPLCIFSVNYRESFPFCIPVCRIKDIYDFCQ
ncbi:MAG: hypothetical protein ACI9W6_002783 [Motiliproteus sp.]|jgi:hypothetical protein